MSLNQSINLYHILLFSLLLLSFFSQDMGSDKENHLHSSCSSQTSEVPSSIEDSENER